MSTSSKIKCPECSATFDVSDVLEKNLRANLSKEFEKEASKLRDQLSEERTALVAKEQSLQVDRTNIERELARRLEASRKSLETAAKEAASVELNAAKQEIEEQSSRLQEAQKNEIELRKQQRLLEQERNEFQLKLTRQLDAERSKIVEETSRRASEEHALKSAEWEKQRLDLLKQVDEMRRKAEQGSQQAQGETFELSIEASLKEAFPHDSIEPVAKGIVGGDILQVVNTKHGARCGAILFELKRTKSFSEGWIQKLKDNQREAKADLAVIVTVAMPASLNGERIGQIDGVWIVEPKSFMGLTLALRASLFEVASARKAEAGRKEKATEAYDYLNGIEFRSRVQTIVESFVAMQEELNAEKRAVEKIWSKRDKQITRVISTTAGLYGEIQEVIGVSLPEIKALALESVVGLTSKEDVLAGL